MTTKIKSTVIDVSDIISDTTLTPTQKLESELERFGWTPELEAWLNRPVTIELPEEETEVVGKSGIVKRTLALETTSGESDYDQQMQEQFDAFNLNFATSYMPTALAAPSVSGTGTEEDPFVCYTIEDLHETINNNLNAFVELGGDIDAKGYVWTRTVSYFHGSLDGKGYTISDLQLAPTSDASVEVTMFALSDRLRLKNLTLLRPVADTTLYPWTRSASIICGTVVHAAAGTELIIDNVHIVGAYVNAYANGDTGDFGRGIFISEVRTLATITNCSITDSVLICTQSQKFPGGFVGWMYGAGGGLTMSGCKVENTVIYGGYGAAAILNYYHSAAQYLTIEDCEVDHCTMYTGRHGNVYVAGILGYKSGAANPMTISRCNVSNSSIIHRGYSGGVAGRVKLE